MATLCFGDGADAIAEDVALQIAVRRGNELRVRPRSDRMKRGFRRRRPSPAGADIERVVPQTFERSETHRVYRGFGDANASRLCGAKPKQNLRSTSREAAPFGTALLPSCLLYTSDAADE